MHPPQTYRHLFRCWVQLLILMFWLVTPAGMYAQQANETATIVGQLRVARSSFPSLHVLVKLERSGAQVAVTYSDAEGKFSFPDLLGNLYHIVIQEEGYQPVSMALPVNPSVQHTVLVQIELTPKDQPQPSGRPTLTGGNPALVDEATLLQKFPKKATQQYEKASRLQQEGKREQAIEHYEQALKLAPDMYFARNNLGSLYLETQKFDQAENQFRQVITTNQADANGYFNLANVYLLTKRWDEALNFAKQGLARQPQSALGHFLMGSVMFQKGSQKEAEQNLRTALNEDPGMANAHLALVNLYLQQRRNADAAQELQVFLKQAPDSNFAPQARTLLKKLNPGAILPR